MRRSYLPSPDLLTAHALSRWSGSHSGYFFFEFKKCVDPRTCLLRLPEWWDADPLSRPSFFDCVARSGSVRRPSRQTVSLFEADR